MAKIKVCGNFVDLNDVQAITGLTHMCKRSVFYVMFKNGERIEIEIKGFPAGQTRNYNLTTEEYLENYELFEKGFAEYKTLCDVFLGKD